MPKVPSLNVPLLGKKSVGKSRGTIHAQKDLTMSDMRLFMNPGGKEKDPKASWLK